MAGQYTYTNRRIKALRNQLLMYQALTLLRLEKHDNALCVDSHVHDCRYPMATAMCKELFELQKPHIGALIIRGQVPGARCTS